MAKSPLLLPEVDSFYWQQDSLFSASEHDAANLLWLAVYFPNLAIETSSDISKNSILVAVEQIQGKTFVHTSSSTAEHLGIFAGMPINAAYSLCPKIKVISYEPEQQKQQLKKIAIWAGQFSSKISIYESSTLVLEVLGSIKLFGGLSNLLHIIRERLYLKWPYRANFSVTPTPAASFLLSSTVGSLYQDNSDFIVVNNKNELRSRLGKIRLSCLPLTKKTNKQLHRLGLRTVRDLLRLPKADIARRYGQELSTYLDRLLGLLPDPQNYHQENEIFRSAWPLEFETKNSQLILTIVARLLQQLQQFLQKRDLCLQSYAIYFEHFKKKSSVLYIHFRQANRDSKRFFLLFEEKFQQFNIEAAIVGVQLFADKFEQFTGINKTLAFSPQALPSSLPMNEKDDAAIDALLELLQARMGISAINTLHVLPDHRPKYAFQFEQHRKYSAHRIEKVQSKNSLSQVALCDRPLWFLLTPELLTRNKGVLYYQSALTLVSGPERIESGWWSTDAVYCDYYVATAQSGMTLWVYQELCKPYQWYVHGFFA